MSNSIRPNIYRSLASTWAWYEMAYRDDRKFTMEDLDETALWMAYNAWVWSGPALLARAGPVVPAVEAIIVAGAVASAAIGGVEGVENYVDFISEPEKMPERWEFTKQTIYEEVIEEPLVSAAKWYVKTVDKTLDTAWQFTAPLRENRFLTSPYLPF